MDAQCNTPLCCRPENGWPKDPKNGAGFWGDYNCDLPHNTLVDFMQYVRDEIKPDMFIWTGDNSAHDVWKNSNPEVIEYVKNITDTLIEQFEGTNVTFFPIQGNHDTWPVNVQDFSDEGINVPLNTYMQIWKEWLGEEAVTELNKYGYYSKDLVLKDGRKPPHTKVIGVNT